MSGGIDYTGQQGGLMALSFAAGWAACAAVLIPIGNFIWKTFGKARIRELEAECARLTDRIQQLETVLLVHGPPALRNAMQAAISENHLEARGVPISEKGK